MKKTLYVSDLDGTLLNKKSRLSSYSLNVIHDLIDQGMMFTYATARSLTSARKVCEGLCLSMPVIVYNGAFIIEPNSGEILHSCIFHEDEIMQIKKLMEHYSIVPIVYAHIDEQEKVSYHEQYNNEGISYYIGNRQGDDRLRAVDALNQLFEGSIFYFTCIGSKEELLALYEEIKKREICTCVFQQEIYREEYWLEIMPKNATKANAIAILKKMYELERVVSFGDSLNDLSMFSVSDESYAVSNAVAKLKEVASDIIPDNEHEGVAKWLSSHILSKNKN